MRAQLAFDYIVTYGLAVALVTAAFVTFIEYDPLNLVRESALSQCDMGSELQCDAQESVVDDEGNLKMSVKNMAGNPVKITKIKFAPDGEDVQLLEDDFSDGTLNIGADEITSVDITDNIPLSSQELLADPNFDASFHRDYLESRSLTGFDIEEVAGKWYIVASPDMHRFSCLDQDSRRNDRWTGTILSSPDILTTNANLLYHHTGVVDGTNDDRALHDLGKIHNISYTDGKWAQAIHFDEQGTNEYIEISSNPLGSSNSFTVTFWMRIQGSENVNRTIIGSSNALVTILADSNNIQVNIGDTPLTVPNAVSWGDWEHVIISADADTNNLSLFIDGTLQASTSSEINSLPSTILLGKDNTGNPLFGASIDGLKTFDDVLSTKAIQELGEGRQEYTGVIGDDSYGGQYDPDMYKVSSVQIHDELSSNRLRWYQFEPPGLDRRPGCNSGGLRGITYHDGWFTATDPYSQLRQYKVEGNTLVDSKAISLSNMGWAQDILRFDGMWMVLDTGSQDSGTAHIDMYDDSFSYTGTLSIPSSFDGSPYRQFWQDSPSIFTIPKINPANSNELTLLDFDLTGYQGNRTIAFPEPIYAGNSRIFEYDGRWYVPTGERTFMAVISAGCSDTELIQPGEDITLECDVADIMDVGSSDFKVSYEAYNPNMGPSFSSKHEGKIRLS